MGEESAKPDDPDGTIVVKKPEAEAEAETGSAASATEKNVDEAKGWIGKWKARRQAKKAEAEAKAAQGGGDKPDDVTEAEEE